MEVTVRFFPEARKWDESTEPKLEISPIASRFPARVVHLAERVLFHSRAQQVDGDPVVEVVIEGETVFLDKAKYDAARELGIQRCTNGFYLDRVLMPLDG